MRKGKNLPTHKVLCLPPADRLSIAAGSSSTVCRRVLLHLKRERLIFLHHQQNIPPILQILWQYLSFMTISNDFPGFPSQPVTKRKKKVITEIAVVFLNHKHQHCVILTAIIFIFRIFNLFGCFQIYLSQTTLGAYLPILVAMAQQ